jgi:hypothetical protein
MRACVEGPVFNGARIWWDRWFGETDETANGGAAASSLSEGARSG